MPMSTTWASKISWILSPTRSYIACMSRFWARPSWTLLMSASSAARSSVSASRRFVSSKRRAFSSATLRLPASVISSRTSDSEKAFSRSRFCSEITPRASPATIERREQVRLRRLALDRRRAGPARSPAPSTSSLISSGSRVSSTCLRRPMIGIGSSGKRTPRSMVYGKWIASGVPVEDADVHDLRVEDLLDLVADQVVHRLHVQVLGEALLDAGDDRQLGGALIGLGQQALRLVEEPRFSSATPMLDARVESRRSSLSV